MNSLANCHKRININFADCGASYNLEPLLDFKVIIICPLDFRNILQINCQLGYKWAPVTHFSTLWWQRI